VNHLRNAVDPPLRPPEAIERIRFKVHAFRRQFRINPLREMDELETDEICRMLTISPSNLWVMLHRARIALRECLEVNWFAEKT
jgi:hypothetical protein